MILLLALAALWPVQAAWGDTSSPAPASSSSSSLAGEPEGAPVVVWNRTVVTLYAPYHGMTADERAHAASERIESALDTLKADDLSISWIEAGGEKGAALRAGNLVLFGILPGDIGTDDRASIEQAAGRGAAVLRDIIRERELARQPRLLLVGVMYSVLATMILIVLCWGLIRLDRFVQHKLIAVTQARLRLDVAGFDLRPMMWTLVRRSVSLVRLALTLFFGYLWLSFVLKRFPYSRPWGSRLGEYLMEIGLQLMTALVNQLPNLLTLVVIFLVTRAVTRLIAAWFRAVEEGAVQVGWLEAPTARVTSRLVSMLVWLFALIVAYPYIPGAGTDAFKGVSVFVGLMLSLGSAGIVNQVMSGLVVLYSRAVRVGDFVRVGDHEGMVVEMGALSMKLVTRKREEITVPNSVLSSTSMRNYTRQSRDTGLLITTSVTIGYDTPWRQVVAMLEQAAARTEGLQADPPPFVLQTALSDFYIEYQLNVAIQRPSSYVMILSELNRNIVDIFNEFSVQIMSPHFEEQPKEKVWVPHDQWYAAPASRDRRPTAPPMVKVVPMPDGKPPV
ncbi:mechanosensitive ion channel family protein [Dyella jiangningensis]